ncbi:MAG: ChbG/HpnK family deacetylase, partial [Planctomycetes bacterium]|nr:ChbG/HpnK family deacetylase [Planctomycetota bacterium]
YGVVTSATLAVNMPSARQAAESSKKYPNLGVGIHLNIVRGKPVLPVRELPDLINESGVFRYRFLDLYPIQIRKPPQVLQQVEAEYRAQIEQALAWGLEPTHLDSERHHACWPILFRIMAKLASEYKIPALRLQREPFRPSACLRGGKPFAHTLLMRLLLLRAGKILKHYGLQTPNRFYGTTHIGEVSKEYILELAGALPEGVTELMTHPGYRDEAAPEEAASYLDEKREGEMRALTSPGITKALDEMGVELVNFKVFKQVS